MDKIISIDHHEPYNIYIYILKVTHVRNSLETKIDYEHNLKHLIIVDKN